EGYKCKDITTRVGIGVRQVQKWIKKFRDGGGEDIPTPKPRSGRPRKIQNRTSKVIKRQLDKNPTLTARKLKENNPALLQDVSVRCISDHLLKDLQYRSCCAKVLPLLSAKNVRDRIAFSKKYKDWTLEDWEQVLWSDESTFVVSSGCRSKRWLEDCGVDYFKKWPGNSPDLNPIEHDRDASTVAKLKIEIQDIWDNIIPQHVEKLARCIPQRLEKVIKLRGKSLGK
ncbi:Transposable element Tc3 transposase-like 3, partial [Homarus americanus]